MEQRQVPADLRFSLPSSGDYPAKSAAPTITEEDVKACYANRLFQAVRDEIERRSRKTRLASVRKESSEELKERILLVQGLEAALALFDKFSPASAGRKTYLEEIE